jgi:hypothetical protein
MFVESRT